MATRRPLGVTLGPVILLGGLAVWAGLREAASIRSTVVAWGDALEHAAAPVHMEMPVYVPLVVGGEWVGRVDRVVVQRQQPGAFDSLRVEARVKPGPQREQLQECAALRLRLPDSDLTGLTRALRCVSDTAGLEPFGRLILAHGAEVPLVHRPAAPCSRAAAAAGVCRGAAPATADHARALAAELRSIAVEIGREVQPLLGEGIDEPTHILVGR